MFIPCPFLFAGIRTLISTFGNRTLSGRATSDETIRSCSPVSGIGCRCNFLSLLKFLSVGAMSQHATQIPYLTISEETVCPSPILPGMRHSAEPPHKTSSSQVSACRQKNVRPAHSETHPASCPHRLSCQTAIPSARVPPPCRWEKQPARCVSHPRPFRNDVAAACNPHFPAKPYVPLIMTDVQSPVPHRMPHPGVSPPPTDIYSPVPVQDRAVPGNPHCPYRI